jgi:hypothetical protein
MKLKNILFSILTLISLGCCHVVYCEEIVNNTKYNLLINKFNKNKVIELKVSLDKERELQAEVDNGHQPWRLNPIDVAVATLLKIDKTIDIENCTLISSTEEDSKVKCDGTKSYFVNLKRLTKPFGIWTAVSIAISE